MMQRGKIVLDRSGAEKAATGMEELLSLFNRYSLEEPGA